MREIAKGTTVSWYNGDNPEDIDRLELRSAGDVLTVLHQADTLVIDEAQRLPNIGLTLKRLVDANETETKPTRIFVTRSSGHVRFCEGEAESQYELRPLYSTYMIVSTLCTWFSRETPNKKEIQPQLSVRTWNIKCMETSRCIRCSTSAPDRKSVV